jgi:hypothetical protein
MRCWSSSFDGVEERLEGGIEGVGLLHVRVVRSVVDDHGRAVRDRVDEQGRLSRWSSESTPPTIDSTGTVTSPRRSHDPVTCPGTTASGRACSITVSIAIIRQRCTTSWSTSSRRRCGPAANKQGRLDPAGCIALVLGARPLSLDREHPRITEVRLRRKRSTRAVGLRASPIWSRNRVSQCRWLHPGAPPSRTYWGRRESAALATVADIVPV